jgi:transposase-like protein
MKSKFGRRLTLHEKEEIKQLLVSGHLSHRAIAERHGVTPGTVSGWAVKMSVRRGRGPLSPAHPQHASLKKAVPNV